MRWTASLLVLLGACRREAPRVPRVDLRVDVAVSARADVAAPVDAGGERCGPVFAEDDFVAVTDDAAPTLACDGARLAARWRAQGAEVLAAHPLRDGTAWETSASPPSPALLGGALLVQQGEAHALDLGRDLSLALRSGAPMTERARVALAALGLREPSSPRLLRVMEGRALAALNARVSGGEREVWLVAFGGGPAALSSMGRGTLGAVHAGAHALVTTVVSVDGATSLRGRWLDADAALRAMPAGRVTLGRELRTDASISLPHRGVEFSHGASAEGALMVQGVIGAERGAASFARFGRDGGAREVFFGAIPSALGDVVSDGEGHTVHWWDERYRPRARVFGEGEPRDLPKGPPAGDAFAALRAAERERWLRCGGATWRVRVSRGVMRAARECAPRGG